MFWTNVKRMLRGGLTSFWRDGFVSFTSIVVMVVTLSTIGAVIFLIASLQSSLTTLKNKVDINVYFVTSAAEDDILALKRTVDAMPDVAATEYISREKALENFRARHASDSLTLQALDELGENPLGAVLNVRAKEPSAYETIAHFLKNDATLAKGNSSIIEKVNYYDNKAAIDRLTSLIASAERLGLIFSVVLVLLSIMIAFNTIRLAIYVAREEISVMRLVGASSKYIRGPFVVSGILYGAIAAIITLGLFYPATYSLGDATENFFGGMNVYSYYLTHFGEIFGIIVGSGIFIGAVGSFLAVRKYLNG